MKRNKFSLSNYRLTTAKMGILYPIGLTEVLPGDTIQQATSMLIRTTPLQAPVMHPVNVRIHHWFVPFRLIWDRWEDFITGGQPDQSVPVLPYINASQSEMGKGTLADHLGICPSQTMDVRHVNVLPFRAYQKIFNEFYRDQDIVPEATISMHDGEDIDTNCFLQRVAWERDYFTSSRPWTQKGDDVTIPSSTVEGDGSAYINVRGGIPPNDFVSNLSVAPGSMNVMINTMPQGDPSPLWFNGEVGLQTNALTINQLREAFALQRYAEARARYGSRYVEYLRYLGIKASDGRLQRPEYLGGGKQVIQFSEILQTGPDTEGEGVGNLKGHGIGALRSNRYRRFFEEHGYIVSLAYILPKTVYGHHTNRLFFRRSKEDFFQRELQHIGQQEVYTRELHPTAQDSDVFGYQDRYDEYRHAESTIHGDFRDTMNHWHMARLFDSPPVMNRSFIEADPSVRIYQEQTADPLWLMVNHSIQARRIISKTGNPI